MARLRALGAALLAAGLLCVTAACEDEPKPDIADPTPTATSPSATEPTPSTSPTAEPLTPEETVRAWFGAFSAALRTGDVAVVSRLSTSDCLSCQRLIRKVTALYEKGGSLRTKGWEPTAIAPQPDSPTDGPVLIAQVTQARQVLLDADGKQVDVTPEKTLAMRVTLLRTGSWVVSRLEILA